MCPVGQPAPTAQCLRYRVTARASTSRHRSLVTVSSHRGAVLQREITDFPIAVQRP
jgi:hypothetical protein